MSFMKLHWYIIPSDGPFPWRPEGRRTVDLEYLRLLAGTVDHLGYDGALMATGGNGHDLWTLSSFLAAHTRRMKFIIAQHPGHTSPFFMAQQAATFDRLSSGRLIINIVNGSNSVGSGHGVFLGHDERYKMAEEYWRLWTRLVRGENLTVAGKYFTLRNARLDVRSRQQPYPELYFGGSSPAALKMAAGLADTYLTYGEPPPVAGEKISRVRELAALQGRTLHYGVRLHVIVRETREEAWEAAQWLYDRVDPAVVEELRRNTRESGSLSQERMGSLWDGSLPRDARAWEIYPDLWSGIGLTRVGNAVAIVGDPETVAARLRDYEAWGFDTFILSGYPLLEEAFRFAELVMPLLRNRKELSPDPAPVLDPKLRGVVGAA